LSPVLRLRTPSYDFLTISRKKGEGTTGDIMLSLKNKRIIT